MNKGIPVTFRNLKTDHEDTCLMWAYWEVALDPISDDYLPSEISAGDLFYKWLEYLNSNGMNPSDLPIYWYVATDTSRFEAMPYQVKPSLVLEETFLTYFTWPKIQETGEYIRWCSLPVVDKLWRGKRSDKGGFIQQFTGWKPGVLQPSVNVNSLLTK